MIIPFKTFTGAIPRTKAFQLPENAAQTAVDCAFGERTLRGLPLNTNTGQAVSLSAVAVYVHDVFASDLGNTRTFTWDKATEAVASPVVSDAYKRVYWSNADGFFVTSTTSYGSSSVYSMGTTAPDTYRVGVPQPSAPTKVTAALALPGVTGVAFTIYDERQDGSLVNEETIGAWEVTTTNEAATLKYAFTARCPQEAEDPENEPPPSTGALKFWGYGSLTPDIIVARTMPVPQVALQVNMPGSTVPDARTANMYFIYDDPVGLSESIDVVIALSRDVAASYGISLAAEDDGYWFVRRFYRLRVNGSGAFTTWYGTIASLAAPSDTNASGEPTLPPFIGPLVLMTMTRTDGTTTTKLEAKLREDSNESSWPPELPGFSAKLVVVHNNWDCTYTVQISVPAEDVERRAYTCTYVNAWGEEGPPSDPLELDCAENATVALRYAAVGVSGYVPITKVRFYRTAPGATTAYLYVAEVTYTSNYNGQTYSDSVKNSALGHTLDTFNYYKPSQTLRGVKVMANGIMVGFQQNEVCFSEPYLPYAWNPSATKPFPHRIVDVQPFEGGLYVLTTAGPYLVTGAAPEFMTDARIAVNQGCLAMGAVAAFNGGVVYASNDGLVMLQGMSASLEMSFLFFTRAAWRAAFSGVLPYLRLSVFDGALLGWFSGGGANPFYIRYDEDTPSYVRLTDSVRAACYSPVSDQLYVVTGTTLQSFQADYNNRRAFTWHSKNFTIPKPHSFGALSVMGSGTITASLYVDGGLFHSFSNTSISGGQYSYFRLPSGYLRRRWSLKIEGQAGAEIQEMYLSTTISELKNV